MSDTTIISLHIYKTAGSTFLAIIDRQYRKDEIIYANIVGIDNTIALLEHETAEQKKKIKIVHGHFGFGWHRFFQNSVQYITFLRNPVERLISDYYYNKTFKGGHNHLYASRMTLEEYILCDEIINVDNGQTRFVSGDFTTPYGKCSDVMLQQAIDNIEDRFAFVGLTERFDETLVLCRHYLGWKNLYYEQMNVTKNKEKKKDERIAALIAERNQIDIQLYKYAHDNFEKKLQAIPGYEQKLNRLQRINRLYNKVHPLYKKLKG